MVEEKTLLVGIDLCDDFTQIGCYIREKGQPDSVSLSTDKTKYRIPTLLCACRDTNEWFFGDQAQKLVGEPGCVRIGNLISMAEQGAAAEVFGKSYPADILLERFLRRVFGSLKQSFPGQGIKGVTVTLKHCNEKLKKVICSAMEMLGIREDRLRIITHLESFMHYIVSQNKDIWINDVSLFDYTADGLAYYRLSFGRKQTPMTVVAEKQDFSDTIGIDMLQPENMDRLLYAFENLTGQLLHRQIISALYVTGSGFESSWSDDILKGLCTGRRVFRGQNLYVKGACYAARMFFDGGVQEYLLIGEDMLKSSVAIKVYHDADYEEYLLADIGENYYEAGKAVTVIMDETNELDFIIHNVLKKDFVCAIMTLETINLRRDKSMRLHVSIRFPNRDTAVITVRDTGFGDIYPKNNRIWEQVLKI